MGVEPSKGWPEGWRGVAESSEAVALDDQLYSEMAFGHPLHRLAPTAIGRRDDQDDVLFRASDGRVAEVHLTWSTERDPQGPWTTLHETLDSWAVAWVEE